MDEDYIAQRPEGSEPEYQPKTPRHRNVNPDDIAVPSGYKIEVFMTGLTTPINIIFVGNDMYVADAGVADGIGKVLKLTENGFKVIADGFNPPLTGINYHSGKIYVSHRGFITTVDPDGSKKNVLSGQPSLGDHHNNQVIFGVDGKMYFGQGTATNSGVVGVDNQSWVVKYPFFHDYPGSTITLRGQNFVTENFLTEAPNDMTATGAYQPFGTSARPGEVIKGVVKASGSILRANPDGSDLELVAWGLRNPFRMKFDCHGRLFTTNHGMDVRGSRPVDNSPDEFWLVSKGAWYGWPDFTGGMPVTNPMFNAPGHPQPTFILAQHPMTPPRPFALFKPHAAIMGFDFNYNIDFGYVGDAFIAEFGSEAPETTGGIPEHRVGHRVSRIDINTGQVVPFAVNKSGLPASLTGGGGFDRPIDVVFGPEGDMYIADFTLSNPAEPDEFYPGTGVIWRISKKG